MRTPLTRFRNMLMIGAAALLGQSQLASAAPATYYELVSDCSTSGKNCGPQSENDGPGTEQAKGDWFVAADGKIWVDFVAMSAKDIPNRNEGPYQCRLWAWTLDGVHAPVRQIDGLLLTQNQGDRPCNHPDLVYAGGTDMVFMYGTNDANQTNVQWYAQYLNGMTGDLGPRKRLSDGNGNDGAGTLEMLRTGGSLDALSLPTAYPKRFVTCYNDNGNNADCTVAQLESNGSITEVAAIDDVIDPANIPRPVMQQISVDGKFVVTAAKGDQRPPEDGAYLRVIDVANPNADYGHGAGKVTRQQALMMSDNGAGVYANSPEVYAGPMAGQYWAMNTTSYGGGGDNGKNKGTSTLYAHLISFDASYNLQIMSTAQVGHYSAHASMCTSSYGADGSQDAVLAEAAITGSGPATATNLHWDTTKTAIVPGVSKVASSYSGDSGYLANLYGNNPNTQGRDFQSCVGSIPNPGYGKTTGWQSDVQTFVAMPSYGMMAANDYKNSFFVSFLPAYTPQQDPGDDTPPPTTGGGDGSGGGTGGGDGSGAGTPDPTKSGGAGGCAAGGSSSGAAGFLLLLGACFVASRRRR